MELSIRQDFLMNDVEDAFQCIFIYDILNKTIDVKTVENAKKFTTLHPRCGTNFLFIVMATSIILFSFFGWPNILVRIIMRILCIPIVAGISYEIIKFLGKYNNILSKIVAYPGMMLQHITTNEPEDDQLEVAIKALKAVI